MYLLYARTFPNKYFTTAKLWLSIPEQYFYIVNLISAGISKVCFHGFLFLSIFRINEFLDCLAVLLVCSREVVDGSLLQELLGIAEMRGNVVTQSELLLVVQDLVEENPDLMRENSSTRHTTQIQPE